jgi:hypothetical protein
MKWRPRFFYMMTGLCAGFGIDEIALGGRHGWVGVIVAGLCFALAWEAEHSTST